MPATLLCSEALGLDSTYFSAQCVPVSVPQRGMAYRGGEVTVLDSSPGPITSRSVTVDRLHHLPESPCPCLQSQALQLIN